MRNWTVAFAVSTILGLGCGAVDRTVDCTKICQKHRDCVDNNYNVNTCTDYCTTQAKNDSNYGQKVNDCSTCVETRACADVATQCAATTVCPRLP